MEAADAAEADGAVPGRVGGGGAGGGEFTLTTVGTMWPTRQVQNPAIRVGQMSGTVTARLGVEDVRLRLGVAPDRGLSGWIHDRLRDAVLSGSLRSGSALPSGRALAADLGVARGTVTGALDQLVAEGLLLSAPRARLVIAAPPGPAGGPAAVTSMRAPTSPGTPDPTLFPRSGWLSAMRDALSGLGSDDLGYPDPQGLPALRTAIAAHLHRSRGVRTEPDHVVVIAGVAQGLALAARVLGPGGQMAVEDPASPGGLAMLRDLGLELRPVPVDDRGLRVERIDSDVAAVMVTPAHQYPLGVPMAPDRRRALVGWAGAARNRWILEDDYDGELRYDRLPVPALQSLDPDRVLLAGSVSKTLSPALRLGWLVAPPRMIAELVDGKRSADLGCSVPEQATLAAFLDSGAYGRHTRRVRVIYRRRRQLLADALARELPALPVFGVAAGLHLAIGLRDPVQETRVLERHAELTAGPGVAGAPVQPMSVGAGPSGHSGVVVGTARMTPTSVSALIRALRDVL